MALTFDRFIEAVNSGKIEGLSKATIDGIYVDTHYYSTSFTERDSDHLCAHLRRWMASKDYDVTLSVGHYLQVERNSFSFITSEDSELDWHVWATLCLLQQEEEI